MPQVTTRPGGALGRATTTLTIDLNAVSHVNKYGDLPHCVIRRNYFLGKWCVCKDKV